MAARLAQADVSITAQKGASCCYAKSDKYWTIDPQGVAWESFHTLDSVPMYGAGDAPGAREAKAACCSPPRMKNVLFLCTGNSARSILAEAYLNAAGKGRFAAYSAGSHPAGKVNPFALELLRKNRMPTAGLRSKSWDEFARPARRRWISYSRCATTPPAKSARSGRGSRSRAHWGVADPAAVEGSDADKRRAFLRAYAELSTRINMFLSLPLDKLDRLALKKKLEEIGRAGQETPQP